jgi:hypothetical protein
MKVARGVVTLTTFESLSMRRMIVGNERPDEYFVLMIDVFEDCKLITVGKSKD